MANQNPTTPTAAIQTVREMRHGILPVRNWAPLASISTNRHQQQHVSGEIRRRIVGGHGAEDRDARRAERQSGAPAEEISISARAEPDRRCRQSERRSRNADGDHEGRLTEDHFASPKEANDVRSPIGRIGTRLHVQRVRYRSGRLIEGKRGEAWTILGELRRDLPVSWRLSRREALSRKQVLNPVIPLGSPASLNPPQRNAPVGPRGPF